MTSEPIRGAPGGLDRIAQAGGQPASVAQVGCELQQDWARQETAEGFTQILFGGDRPRPGLAASPPATELARAAETGPLSARSRSEVSTAGRPPGRNWPNIARCDADRRRRCCDE